VAEAKRLYLGAREIASGSEAGLKALFIMFLCAGAGGAVGSRVGGVVHAAVGAGVLCLLGGLYFEYVVQREARVYLRKMGYPRD
jgi:hypothetical protein